MIRPADRIRKVILRGVAQLWRAVVEYRMADPVAGDNIDHVRGVVRYVLTDVLLCNIALACSFMRGRST